MTTHYQLRHELSGHRGAIFGLTRGREPWDIFTAGGDGWVVHWDLRNPDPGEVGCPGGELMYFSLLALPERDHLLAGDMHGGVHWIDLADPDHQLNFLQHPKGTYALLGGGPRHL